jgi:hypothetical protein
MCNPRRIRVRATRELAEDWDHEVRRVVNLSRDVAGEARISEQLGPTVGAPTLAALVRVLDRTEGWERSGTTFRHELDGGWVAYDMDTQELEIVARVSDSVEARGEASTAVRRSIRQRIEAEGVGVHYDDNWRGITEQDARDEATRHAQLGLDGQAEGLREQVRSLAEDEHGLAVEAAAAARAGSELDQIALRREEELRRDAGQRLVAIGVAGRTLFHRALAEAYRDAILAYARAHGADGIVCTERDGVVDIEFELQM